MANKTTFIAEPGKQEVKVIREFDAPRELVFKVMTDPKLAAQWWGPKNLQTVVEKMDVKSGGSWRMIHKDTNGNEFAFHGVYHDVTAPSRVIDTFEYEGLPESGHVILETMKLEELPGNRTKLVVQSVYQSVEDRDGMVHAGMEYGQTESYERLDQLLLEHK
jgi:uncharacterized protein YndB with AHSA1/START domain